MQLAFDSVLPENRTVFKDFLNIYQLDTVYSLVTSIHPVEGFNRNLADLVKKRMDLNEQWLTKILVASKYEIDSSDTMEVLFGNMSLEKVSISTSQTLADVCQQYIMPLIYLVLQHHLNFIRVGAEEILDEREMRFAEDTLGVLHQVVRDRIKSLKGIYLQIERPRLFTKFF